MFSFFKKNTALDEFIKKNNLETPNLKEIVIEYKEIVIPNNLNKLNKVKKLILNKNNLNEISKYIYQLTNLEELHITSNNITDIDKNIQKLNNLIILNLKNNDFIYFPNSIFELRKLELIDFSKNNNLKNIPYISKKLSNIKKIIIRDIKLLNYIHFKNNIKLFEIEEEKINKVWFDYDYYEEIKDNIKNKRTIFFSNIKRNKTLRDAKNINKIIFKHNKIHLEEKIEILEINSI